MSLINTILLLLAGFNLALALVIFLRNPKNKINIYFALAVFFVGTWTFGIGMFREAENEFTARIWTWVQNGSGSLIVIPFLFFSFVFPYPSKKISILTKILIWISVLVVTYVVMMPDIWYKFIYLQPPNNDYEINLVGYFYFVIYFLFYILWAFYNLIKKYLTSAGFQRQQLKYILVGSGILGSLGTFFGVILPYWTNVKYNWPGPYFSVAMMFFITYFLYIYPDKIR